MLIKLLLLLVLAVVIGAIIVGIALIRDSIKPFKDEKGEPRTLTAFEKVLVAVAGSAFVLAILALVLPIDHPWIKKFNRQKS